jgi:hypothetical protein
MFASSAWRTRHEVREVHDASRERRLPKAQVVSETRPRRFRSLRPDQVAARDKRPQAEANGTQHGVLDQRTRFTLFAPTKADHGPSSWKRRFTWQPLRTYRDQDTYPLGRGSQARPHMRARHSAGSCVNRERYRRCAAIHSPCGFHAPTFRRGFIRLRVQSAR